MRDAPRDLDHNGLGHLVRYHRTDLFLLAVLGLRHLCALSFASTPCSPPASWPRSSSPPLWEPRPSSRRFSSPQERQPSLRPLSSPEPISSLLQPERLPGQAPARALPSASVRGPFSTAGASSNRRSAPSTSETEAGTSARRLHATVWRAP